MPVWLDGTRKKGGHPKGTSRARMLTLRSLEKRGGQKESFILALR
jgi:hypothetical protein